MCRDAGTLDDRRAARRRPEASKSTPVILIGEAIGFPSIEKKAEDPSWIRPARHQKPDDRAARITSGSGSCR
jgi:hypothetical protein